MEDCQYPHFTDEDVDDDEERLGNLHKFTQQITQGDFQSGWVCTWALKYTVSLGHITVELNIEDKIKRNDNDSKFGKIRATRKGAECYWSQLRIHMSRLVWSIKTSSSPLQCSRTVPRFINMKIKKACYCVVECSG